MRVGRGGGWPGDRRDTVTAVRLDNVRDVGGLPLQDGRTVRGGILYRSGEPYLTPGPGGDGPGPFAMLCDLRSPGERAESGRGPYGDVPTVHIEMMSPENAAGADTARRILADTGGDTAREYMFATYRAMPERLRTAGLRTFVRRLPEPDGHPALVHCRAGKDRTGVFCAVLLLAVGVRADAVREDYLRSDREIGVAQLREIVGGHAGVPDGERSGLDAGALDPMRVRPEYLAAALAEIESSWGGVEPYLRSTGLTGDDLDRLRALLVA